MIKVNYRIRPTIVQTQIDDYIDELNITVYNMWVPKDYRNARKRLPWLYIHHKKSTNSIKLQNCPHQSTIDDYIGTKLSENLPAKKYFSRFRSIPVTNYNSYAEGLISKKEWDMFHYLPKFTGYFNNLFEFVDLSYLDEIQEELETNGTNLKNIFIHDVFAFELLRRQLGFKDYSGLEKMAQFIRNNPLIGVLHDPFYFPIASDVSYVLKRIPVEKMMNLFHDLVKQAVELKIIDIRIGVFDGQFVHSNCENNKKAKTKQYSDPETGYYRYTGKKLGVGYVIWSVYAYCGTWERALPVHFKIFPGNRNDSVAFRETLSELYELKLGKWKMFMCDTGGYCQKNLDFCLSLGAIPLIRAKKNLKTHPTKELKKGFWFNTKYFPKNWSEDEILEMYKERPMVEAGQSANPTFYNQRRLNTRGLEMAYMNRLLTYCLDLMRAISAMKVGRPDLTTKLRAFSSAREFTSAFTIQKLARDSNYLRLMEPSLNARQKEFWDNWKKKKQEREKKSKMINS